MICAEVAFATGQPLAAVARGDFAWTLYTLWQLRQRELRDARIRDAEGLRAAVRTNYAFAAPEQLQQEVAALRAGTTPLPSREEARAMGARILAAAKAAGWVATEGGSDA